MIWQQLIVWVISFVLSDYFRERLPAQTASGLGDFTIPTATEGRVVPLIIGGSMRVESPNCVWYGEFAAVERTVTTGVIFTRDETIGFTYQLALQYVQCKTPVAGITGVWIGDDQVFDYIEDAAGVVQSVVDIDRDDLFGGEDNGGGFQGRIRLFDGAEDQAVSAFLDTRLDPLPAYRGTCYIMVTSLDESVGATIGESNQLRYIRVSLQSFDETAAGGLGDAMGLLNDEHFIGEDANPISVAYDLYVNQRWGRAFPPSDIDLASFQAANATCFTEGIGFSQVIDEQTSTGDIQDTIEQHIDGYIGPNPVTGRIEVTLARQDYTPAAEFQATEVNIESIKKWSKGDWSQTWNRVRIRYTDRAKQWNETHAVELAPGNKIIQGGRTKTKELRFQGVHTALVASKIAARTRRGNSQPIASGTIELNRTAYQLRPGSIIVLTSAKIGETNLSTRVTKAGVGNVERNTMEFEVVSDVFDTEIANVTVPPPSDFVPPIQNVIAFGALDQAAFEPPFILMRFNPTPNSLPRIATLARRNAGNTPTEYEVIRRTRNPPTPHAGAYTSTDFVQGGFCTVGTLRNAMIAWQTGNGGLQIQVDPIAPESLDALIGVYSPTSGGGGTGNAAGLAVISPGLADEEFIIIRDIVDDLGGIRLENVYRTAMDTPMKSHLVGAQVWFYWTGGLGMGPELYNQGDGVEMKFLPRSPNDALLEAAALALPEVLMDENTVGRSFKPLLPFTMALNGDSLPVLTDEISFEEMHTGPTFTGMAVLVALRDSLNQSPIGSVTGLDLAQTGFNPSDVTDRALELQWWVHNLDTDPTADRVNAVADSAGFQAQVTATDRFDVAKSQLLASGVEGFEFNARLEVEMRHSPNGQIALNVSHDTFDLEFIATGIFSVLAQDIIIQSHFDGADAAALADEVSPFNGHMQFVGGAEIDTAESEFGGASLLLDGVDSFVRTPMPARWDIRNEWTIEVRLRWAADPAGTTEICGQMDGIKNSWTIAYTGAGNRFEFGYSTTGTNGPTFVAMHTGTFEPVGGTWYVFAFCKEPDGTFHVLVDGVQIGSTASSTVLFFRSGSDLVIGARNFNDSPTAFFDGHMDEMRLTPRCLYQATYTPDVLPFDDGRQEYPLLAHLDGADMDTTYPSEDLNVWDITATGTSEIDTAQSMFGTASLRCDGNDDNGTLGNNDGAWLPETIGARNAAFDFKRGPFTMEAFVRFNALPSTKADGMAIFAKYNRPAGGNRVDWWFYFDPNDDLIFVYSPLGNITSQVVAVSSDLGTLVINTWYHAAVVRIGNDLHLYFEGNRVALEVDFYAAGSLDMPNDLVGNCPFTIARFYDSSVTSRQRALDGWIDEVNIEKRAKYNGGTYTIPAAPLADPNRVVSQATQSPILHLCGFENTDGFATDNIMQTEDLVGSRINFVNQAQIDTANFKFGSSSLLLDGNADSARIHNSQIRHQLLANDFTIDCWADHDLQPHDDGNGGHCLMSQWNTTGNVRQWAFYLNDAGSTTDLVFAWSVDGTVVKVVFVAAVTIVPGTFHHWQVVRQGTSVFMFQDGVLQTNDGASDAIGTDIIFEANREIWIGEMNDASSRDFDGHIDETRITNTAENTSTFTPAVAAYTRPVLPYF